MKKFCRKFKSICMRKNQIFSTLFIFFLDRIFALQNRNVIWILIFWFLILFFFDENICDVIYCCIKIEISNRQTKFRNIETKIEFWIFDIDFRCWFSMLISEYWILILYWFWYIEIKYRFLSLRNDVITSFRNVMLIFVIILTWYVCWN